MVVIFLGSSCSNKKDAPDNPLFLLKNSGETGIRFQNQLQSSDSENILEYLYFYNGGGIAAGDLDNDGLIDLYFTGNQVSNKLYHNKGRQKFEDITESAAMTGEGR
ncbi:MAG: VCBS repeat-containing protein [Bacteroidetes bacterium]|nr:VCBS repeat-containing protein [Bacteroidota bacterium]